MKQLLQLIINKLFTPYGLIISTFVLSALAWLISDFFGLPKAYIYQEPIRFNIIIFFMWMFYLSFPSYLGYKFGLKIPIIKELTRYSNIEKVTIYKIYSFIAISGFSFTVYKTFDYLGLSGFLYAITSFQTNHIAKAIYADYSIGIYSLRYILILSFGYALYRILIMKKVSIIDVINLLFFILYIAFYGRRLQLIASIFVFILLGNQNKKFIYNLKTRLLIFTIIGGFFLLMVATTLRNYGSYQNQGYNNPIVVTIANASEYLAAPFQVSLGTSNNYFKALEKVKYTSYVDVKSTLTANGSFTHLTYKYGLFSIILIAVLCFTLSMAAGWLSKQRGTYLYTGLPIILYGFSELWRIDLFFKGIFITLLSVSVGVPIIYSIFKMIIFKPRIRFK